ncbi:subtilisin-like protein [Ascobolus immersus RN42]|uniref:Subtilisin-like protein n=1 Tax=Ascobolus immersus RN42 TaxID=1160509 RepID=A0A3N4HV38_ASCIM|nr:subtilisin-like protein [Ascobolus immersus RN42]
MSTSRHIVLVKAHTRDAFDRHLGEAKWILNSVDSRCTIVDTFFSPPLKLQGYIVAATGLGVKMLEGMDDVVVVAKESFARKSTTIVSEPTDVSHLLKVSYGGPSEGGRFYFDQDSRGKNVIVYVMDDGVDNQHPELSESGKVIIGATFVQPGKLAPTEPPSPRFTHGTPMASLIAGKTLGVAPEATVCSVQIYPDDDEQVAISGDIIKGMWWATTHAHENGYLGDHDGGETRALISMSFTCPNESNNEELFQAATNALFESGVLCVVSAGNDGKDLRSNKLWPACCERALTVGSANERDHLSGHSNYGPMVGILAPGINLRMAKLGGGFYEADTEVVGGTSAGLPPASPLELDPFEYSNPSGSLSLPYCPPMGSALSLFWKPQPPKRAIDNSVIVTLNNPGYTDEQADRVIEVAHSLGSITADDSRRHDFYISPVMLTFYFEDGADIEKISKTLRALDGVRYAGKQSYATKSWIVLKK